MINNNKWHLNGSNCVSMTTTTIEILIHWLRIEIGVCATRSLFVDRMALAEKMNSTPMVWWMVPVLHPNWKEKLCLLFIGSFISSLRSVAAKRLIMSGKVCTSSKIFRTRKTSSKSNTAESECERCAKRIKRLRKLTRHTRFTWWTYARSVDPLCI